MASPEFKPSAHTALVAASTPRAIHDALVGSERAEFAERYRAAMAAAADSLDLTGVLTVLATYREIAETTRRTGGPAHLRMLAQVEDLQQGRDVPTIGAAEHRAEINARLGR